VAYLKVMHKREIILHYPRNNQVILGDDASLLLGNLALISKVIKCKSKVKHMNSPTLFSSTAHMLLISHHVHVPYHISLRLAKLCS